MPGMAARADTPDPRREQAAGARLPYARHLDDATIETRDGRLLQCLRLAGFPFETADTQELNYRKTVRDTMLRGISNSRFAVYHHVVRREVSPDLQGEFPDPFSRALDEAWRGRLATRRLYVNDLFLTLVRRPLQGRAGLLTGLFGGARGAVGCVRQRTQSTGTFISKVKSVRPSPGSIPKGRCRLVHNALTPSCSTSGRYGARPKSTSDTNISEPR